MHLPLRALAVFEALLSRPGEIISRDELIASAWHGLAVSDGALSEAMSVLRQALGDRADEPRFIETIPRRGYRFVAEIQAQAPAADGAAIVQPPARGTGAAVAETVAQPTAERAARPAGARARAPRARPPLPLLAVGLALAVVLLVWGVDVGPGRNAGTLNASAAAEALANAGAGAVVRELTLPDGTPLEDLNAALSPDGGKLVFSDVSGSGLYVYDLDAGLVRRVVSWPFYLQPLRLRWSPDGRFVAFDYIGGDESSYSTRVIDLD